MAYIHPAFEAHQRKRFTRPDAARWWRESAWPCGKIGFFSSGATTKRGRLHTSAANEQGEITDTEALAGLHGLRLELLSLRSAFLGFKLERLLRKALPPGGGVVAEGSLHYLMQPRVPPGHPDGGQWTADESFSAVRVAQANGSVTDVTGDPHYRPGGHHHMAKGVFKKWKLLPETRAVFEKSTTGPVPGTVRSTPDGLRQGNFWDGPEGLHGEYNRAVEELSERFMIRNGITPEQMTPNQARELLKEIRETEDPRIRTFNNAIRLIQRLYKLRTGRGLE